MSTEHRKDLEDLSWSLRSIIAYTKTQFPDVECITTGQLDDILSRESLLETNSIVDESESNVLVVDIREKSEYDASHLSCAKWVDFSKPYKDQCNALIGFIKEKAEKRKQQDEKLNVFVYCAVGIRASILVSMGQRRLKRLQQKEGSPVDPEKYLNQEALESENIPYSAIRICNVEGSIYKWAHEHRPLVDKDNQKTTLVHCCSTLWGKIFVNKEFRHPGPYPLIF